MYQHILHVYFRYVCISINLLIKTLKKVAQTAANTALQLKEPSKDIESSSKRQEELHSIVTSLVKSVKVINQRLKKVKSNLSTTEEKESVEAQDE